MVRENNQYPDDEIKIYKKISKNVEVKSNRLLACFLFKNIHDQDNERLHLE